MDWSGTTPAPDGNTIPHTLTRQEISARQVSNVRGRLIYLGCMVLIVLLMAFGISR